MKYLIDAFQAFMALAIGAIIFADDPGLAHLGAAVCFSATILILEICRED